jgi:hypothetical protein
LFTAEELKEVRKYQTIAETEARMIKGTPS